MLCQAANVSGLFGRRRAQADGPVGLLGIEETGEAVMAALRRADLHVYGDDDEEIARLVGSPAAIDFWMPTNVTLEEGLVTFDCVLPIPVPVDRLDALLELCMWLSAGGRVAFTIDRCRPCGRVGVDVALASPDAAAETIIGNLQMLWQRMVAFAPAFHAIADGESPEGALAVLDEWASHLVSPTPWSGEPNRGTVWPVIDVRATPLPPGTPIPDGYTAEEKVATVATLWQLASRGRVAGVQDRCPGPVLIHADGTVECYGCTSPGTTLHLTEITVACDEGVRLGDGHVCERCADGRA